MCKLKIPTLLSLSPPHSPSQRLPCSRANNYLSPNRTGFTTASCFPLTSCSCSPLPDSPLASASPVSCYPQTCSCAPPHVIWFGGHLCLPDGSFPLPPFAPLQLLEPLELTSDPSAAELVMLPLWLSLISTCCQSLLLPVPASRGAARGGSLHTLLISKHQYFSTCLLVGFHCIPNPSCCHLPSQKYSGPTGVCLWGGFWNSSANTAAHFFQAETKLQLWQV